MDLPAKTHLFDQIYEILWKKIRTGEIQPGQRIKDSEMADKLGVSRTPVREAMHKMKQEGILIPFSSGGYQVRSASREDLMEIYRCRAALEGLAAEEAAARFDDAAAKKLEELLDSCDQAIKRNDLDRAFELNTEFHITIIELSDNAQLKTLLNSLWRLVVFCRSALLNVAKSGPTERNAYRQQLIAKQERHREIFVALRKKDVVRAAHLMQQHVRETAQDHLPASESEGQDQKKARRTA